MNQRINWELTPEQKGDARRALKMLGGMATLEQAALAFLNGRQSIERKTVADAADEFLHSRLKDGLRSATIEWYDEHLRYIAQSLGGRIMDQITRSEFRAWLDASPRKPASKAGTARAARALWRWALKCEPPLVTQDVTVGLRFAVAPNAGRGSEKFLSVEECASLMKQIRPDCRSAVALMLFAGVRPDEMAGKGKEWLQWGSVNTDERIIRIEAHIMKTGPGRVIEGLPDALWAWLTPGKGNVSPLSRRNLINAAHAASGMEKWKQDGLRHSFASYAMALLNDAGKIANWLGHGANPTMLHRHYRGLVSQADAVKFWALRP